MQRCRTMNLLFTVTSASLGSLGAALGSLGQDVFLARLDDSAEQLVVIVACLSAI